MSQSRPNRLARVLPILAASTAAAFAIPAQAATPQHTFHAPRVIGTSLDVAVVTRDSATAELAFNHIRNEISRLEAMLSTRIETSFISAINRTNEPVAVPAEVIELLTAYKNASALTGGICTPLSGELTARWAAAAKADVLPGEQELSAITERIGQSSLTIDPVAGTVQRHGPATLNIDALGKPFILAKAADAAWTRTKNLVGLIVDIGGDITVRGEKPWTVGVTDPAHPQENAAPLVNLSVKETSVVTSGDAARGRTIAGQLVSHIIDPRSGQPASRGIAATVVHKDPVIGNALATSFCVAGPSAAPDMAARAGAQYLLAGDQGVFISEQAPLADAATAPATQPASWPKGFKATIDFNVLASARDKRAVCLAWVEDSNGKFVKTLAVWGNVNDKDNQRPLRVWLNLGDKAFKTATSRAAGKYPLTWDGTDKDNKPVSQGKYTVHMEVTWEHGGSTVVKTPIDCEADKATTKIAMQKSIDAGNIVYGPAN